MRKTVLLLLLLFGSAVITASTVKVVFSVNMRAMIAKRLFNTAADSVCVRGSFQNAAGGQRSNWEGNEFQMRDPDHDSIYTIELNFNNIYTDTLFEFKFVKNIDYWETCDNRKFVLANLPVQTLKTYWFSEDSSFAAYITVANTITFTVDMTNYYGTGVHYFDPSTDSVLVWGTFGTAPGQASKLRLLETAPSSKRFVTTFDVTGHLGDSAKWKYRFYPAYKFNNNGYELGLDRFYTYAFAGTITVLPSSSPQISLVDPPVGVAAGSMLPEGISLAQNYPNPFNAECIIKYTVDRLSFVNITIFDMNGRECASLVNEHKPAGRFTVRWEAADMPSGVYICRMQTETFSDIKKLVLLK